jgi:phosphoribosylanthranilate isomerase
MRTRIKICCIASIEEAQLAIKAGADALGLVARMPSGPGPIGDERIASIALEVPPPVATFLLTCETQALAISEHIAATRPSVVQIVSHIDPDHSARLAELQPYVRRVQVIHVEDHGALDLIEIYSLHVHAFLLDSGRPNAAISELGGTGRTHDWSISQRFVALSPRPVFLAGGLHVGNVAEAIRQVRPHGVDVCSGVRTDGRLDAVKLQAFMAAVTGADPSLAVQ